MSFEIIEGDVSLHDKDGIGITSEAESSNRRLHTNAVAKVHDKDATGITSTTDGAKQRLDTNALSRLHDKNSTGISSTVDGSKQRIDTNSLSRAHDKDGTGITSQADGASIRRLHVHAEMKPGSAILIGNNMPANPEDIVRKYLADSGGATSMKVNGAVVPVVFTFPANATRNIATYELRFVIGTQDIIFDGASFGSKSALTNGVLVELVCNGGTTVELANLKINEDLLMFPSPANAVLNNTGSKDILVMGLFLGGGPILNANTADKMKITIRDDLTGGGTGELSTFKCQGFGVLK